MSPVTSMAVYVVMSRACNPDAASRSSPIGLSVARDAQPISLQPADGSRFGTASCMAGVELRRGSMEPAADVVTALAALITALTPLITRAWPRRRVDPSDNPEQAPDEPRPNAQSGNPHGTSRDHACRSGRADS